MCIYLREVFRNEHLYQVCCDWLDLCNVQSKITYHQQFNANKMAAPSKKQHHIRGEVCTNRPRYREGRKPKAIKVYTVNQESRYLLVQGVPTVGAQHELVQLFALYGAVEEYRLLDEYPADEFTEVYWIKYSKLQAARYAKRKLDDYSFFGGNLHVCYAPEYESVNETRQKLQERRREIATRLKKLNRQTESTSQPSANHRPDVQASDIVSGSSVSQSDPQEVNRPEPAVNHIHSADQTESFRIPTACPDGHQTQTPYTEPIQHRGGLSSSNPHGLEAVNHSHTENQPAVPPWSLPPPPQPMPPGVIQRHHRGYQREAQWGHARVPSAHATLPRQLQLMQSPYSAPQSVSVQQPVHSQNICMNQISTDFHDSKTQCGSQGNNNHSSLNISALRKSSGKINDCSQIKNDSSKSVSSISEQKEKVIIRAYAPSGAKPTFVPRQLTKAPPKPPNEKTPKEAQDKTNETIRKKALELGKKAGPMLPPSDQMQHDHYNKRKESADAAIEKTRANIREKLKTFSTLDPLPVFKKKRTSNQ